MSRKEILSLLWIFVTLNYLYCDLIGLMDKNLLSGYLKGNIEGMVIDENFLFLAGLLMEIPIAMVVLSRVLNYRGNRWANISAGLIKTGAMIATFFMGSFTTYYLFFALIEISTTLFITGYAVKWKPAYPG